MKNSRQQIIYLIVLFLNLFILNNSKLLAQQNITICPSVDTSYEGNLHFHLTGCTTNIVINAPESSVTENSIVTGIIKTNGSIILRSSSSNSVIVLPVDHSHGDPNARHTGGTDLGGDGSGNGGGRYANRRTTKKNALLLHPNPASNVINLSNFKNDIASYQLISKEGSILLEGSFNNKTTDYDINIEKLKKGFYIVNIAHTTGKITTKALIKE